MRVVAALGGNALLRRGQELSAENQRENARVACRAARMRGVDLVLGREPVDGPLPGVADHVVHTIAVGRERAHR